MGGAAAPWRSCTAKAYDEQVSAQKRRVKLQSPAAAEAAAARRRGASTSGGGGGSDDFVDLNDFDTLRAIDSRFERLSKRKVALSGGTAAEGGAQRAVTGEESEMGSAVGRWAGSSMRRRRRSIESVAPPLALEGEEPHLAGWQPASFADSVFDETVVGGGPVDLLDDVGELDAPETASPSQHLTAADKRAAKVDLREQLAGFDM